MAGSFWSFSQISTLGKCLACVWLLWVGVAYSSLEGEGQISASQKSITVFPLWVDIWCPQDSHHSFFHLVLRPGAPGG